MQIKSALIATVVLLGITAKAQTNPLSHRQLCTPHFMDAVVRIEAGGQSRGSGFLVTKDGYIFTAGHVIRDDGGQYFSSILVHLPDGADIVARPIPQTLDSAGQDYAILKVDGRSNLPFLPIGTYQEGTVGTDATIIGFPFSAISMEDKSVSVKFCLSANFAAYDLATAHVSSTQQGAQTVASSGKDVKVDVIYFQGPSISGLSGSPVISNDSGRVVAILTQKLTGIGPALRQLEKETATPQQGSAIIMGVNFAPTINGILTVLDSQLANGLGAATGIDDPEYALRREQRKNKQ